MSDISKFDRNFAVETSLNIGNIRFYNVLEAPFSVYGVFYENNKFRRIPESVAQAISNNVHNLHIHTAGGRVKFITNSDYVAIQATMPRAGKMPHFALSGSAGFDLYVGKQETYFGSFIPPITVTNGFESVVRFPDRKRREITINFPLYSSISALYIGLNKDCYVKEAGKYKEEKPIVFYGSSITQGGCASRPGNAYTSLVARALKYDHINLGFSGSAKGEDEIAEYISNLDMTAFIYDYDHNATNAEDLAATHQKMFQRIRHKNPELPIIILPRPRFKPDDVVRQRMLIIKKTWEDAIAAGDKNTYFIDGPTLMKYAKNNGTVDGTHPNDLGFYSMARVLTQQLRKILK